MIKVGKSAGGFSIPVRVTIDLSRGCAYRACSRVLLYFGFWSLPLICHLFLRNKWQIVFLLKFFVKNRRIYDAFFSDPSVFSSFFPNERAAVIASQLRVFASWNIWEYRFKVVPTQECPKSPDTATTSMPALIKSEQ